MRPGREPVVAKIVGIRNDLAAHRLRLFDPVNNPATLRISNSLSLGFETKGDLRLHIRGARPPHERLDFPRALGRVLENPTVFCLPRLHRGSGGKVDARRHANPIPCQPRRRQAAFRSGPPRVSRRSKLYRIRRVSTMAARRGLKTQKEPRRPCGRRGSRIGRRGPAYEAVWPSTTALMACPW